MPEFNLGGFDVKRYIGLIHRRRYLAITISVAVLSLFTLASFIMPKTYEASSTVFIERSSLINPLIQGVGVTVSMDERLRNLRAILTSRTIIEGVIKKLNLDKNVKNQTQYEGLIEAVKQSVTINVRSGGDRASDLLFTINYKGNDPKKVVDMVNAHVNECITLSLSSVKTDVAGAYDFISSQLAGYKDKLELSDKLIREFREQHPNMVPQSENTVASRIENFQTAKIDAEIKIRELSKKRENLQKQLSGEKELTVAFVTREGSPQARLNYLNNQLMLLMTKYTPSYPEVIKVKTEIEELKKQIADASEQQKRDGFAHSGSETSSINPIYQQLKEELSRTNAEIDSLRARQSELERQQQAGQTILRQMPKEQEEWSRLQRDRNVYQRIYDDLLNKLESAKVSRDLEIGDKNTTFRIVDPPIIPQNPVKPDRVKMILIGLILGIAAGVGTVIALDHLDPAFKGEDFVETGLKIPLMISIPEILTDNDRLSIAIKDKKVYMATGIYLVVIGCILVQAILQRYFGLSFMFL